ncbi:hypothetical protein GCM10027605_47990 [Micromonospora zhanjiangensis]
MNATKVVAFGGGHGLSASLRALRHCAPQLDLDITAVVTVGDDGGSSGRLRAERDALPPGDLRQALVALAGDHPAIRRSAELFQHRFADRGARRGVPAGPAASDGPAERTAGGPPGRAVAAGAAGDPLAGHAVGNLVLLGLMEQLGDPIAALDHAAAMLGAVGRVLPMTCRPVEIEARVRGADPARPDEVDTVRGQHAVAVTPGRVESLHLTPADPRACAEAVIAVAEADWLIFGPGAGTPA